MAAGYRGGSSLILMLPHPRNRLIQLHDLPAWFVKPLDNGRPDLQTLISPFEIGSACLVGMPVLFSCTEQGHKKLMSATAGRMPRGRAAVHRRVRPGWMRLLELGRRTGGLGPATFPICGIVCGQGGHPRPVQIEGWVVCVRAGSGRG